MIPPLAPSPYSKDYEITDAMFGAFRSPGGAKFFWKLVAWGTLFYAVAFVVTLVPIVRAYIELFRSIYEIEASSAGGDAEAFEALAGFFKIIPLFLLMAALMLLVQAVLQAAFYRAYYDGDVGGAFPFKLGQDEVRQALSLLGYAGLFFGLYVAFILIFGLLVGSAAAGSGGAAAVSGLLGFFGFIGFFVLMIYVLITFSPATALTAYRGQVHVLAARHVSKYRFWALFGSLLVVALITMVVQQVASSLGMIPLLMSFIDTGLFESFDTESPEAIEEHFKAVLGSTSFKIGSLIAVIGISASYAFSYVMFIGPVAFFTQQWGEAHDLEP